MARSRITRRGLLASGAVMAGAAAAGTAARAAGSSSEETPPETEELATVESVSSDGALVLKKADGTAEELRDPRPDEEWLPGHEAVIVRRLIDGSWVVANVQRLYRPILDLEVVDRSDELLETSGGAFRSVRKAPPAKPPTSEQSRCAT